jgi:hypothetical protein
MLSIRGAWVLAEEMFSDDRETRGGRTSSISGRARRSQGQRTNSRCARSAACASSAPVFMPHAPQSGAFASLYPARGPDNVIDRTLKFRKGLRERSTWAAIRRDLGTSVAVIYSLSHLASHYGRRHTRPSLPHTWATVLPRAVPVTEFEESGFVDCRSESLKRRLGECGSRAPNEANVPGSLVLDAAIRVDRDGVLRARREAATVCALQDHLAEAVVFCGRPIAARERITTLPQRADRTDKHKRTRS